MRVIVSSEKLLKVLPSKFGSPKLGVNPLRLVAENGSLTVQFAGIIDAFKVYVPAEVDEDGQVIVDGRFFKQLLSVLRPHDIKLRVQEDQHFLTVSCDTSDGRCEYKVYCYHVDEDASEQFLSKLQPDEATPILTVQDDLKKRLSRLRPFLSASDPYFLLAPEEDEHLRVFAIQTTIFGTTIIHAESPLQGVVIPEAVLSALVSPAILSHLKPADDQDYLLVVHEHGFAAYRTPAFGAYERFVSQARHLLQQPADITFAPSWRLMAQLRDIQKLAPQTARKGHRTRVLFDFNERKVVAFALEYGSDRTDLLVSREFPEVLTVNGAMPDRILVSTELLSTALQCLPMPDRFEYFVFHSVPILRITHGDDAVVLACMRTVEELTASESGNAEEEEVTADA